MFEDELPKGIFLTLEEIADFLRVNPVTVRKEIANGKLRSFRVGNLFRIERQDLIDYLNSTATKERGLQNGS